MAKTKIRGITIELTAETAGIADGLKTINSSLATTDKALKDVNKLLKLDPGNVELIAQKQEYLSKAIEDTQTKLEKEKELLASMQNADNASQTTEQQKALAREIEATTQKLNAYKNELASANGELRESGTESRGFIQNLTGMQSAIESLAQLEAFKMLNAQAKELGESLLDCATISGTFQTAMTKVETLAHAGSGLDAMAEEIKSSAVALGVSSSDFADGVYQAMSAGVAAGDAVQFTRDMTKLAIGGFTDSATAVDIVTTAINAYGLEIESAGHIMDNLIATQNLGKTTVDELAQNMGRVIPVASAYSVNLDNVSAAYAELTAKGMKTDIATTNLTAMFNELGNSGSKVNGIIKDISGKTFGQFMENGGSLADIMNILWEYAGKDKEAFQGLWTQSTAASAAFNIASDGGERFSEVLAEMGNNAGLAEENFLLMADTAEMADARFTTAVDNMKISIGDALLPALTSIKEKGADFIEPFTKFVEANPEFVQALAGAVAGIVGVTTALTAAATAVTLFNLVAGTLTGNVLTLVKILGAGAAIGAVAGLAASMEEGAKSARELNAAVQDNQATLAQNTENYKANSEKITELAGRIKELNAVENLTADQQIELASAIQQWNEMVDINSQLVLDNTGHVEGNTEAIEANIDAASREYDIAMKQEEMAELTKAYTEAKEALAEANERVAEAEEELNAVSEMNMEAHDMAAIKLMAETDARDQLAATCDELSGKYSSLVEEINAETESQTENAGATAENTQMTQEQKEALEQLVEAYEKAKESAIDSLESQREKFEEFSSMAGDSIDTIVSDLQSQAEGMTEYANLIAEAYEIMQQEGDASGILSYYIEQGPAAAGELQSLVEAWQAGGDSLTAFNEAMTAFNETESLIDTIAEMQAAIETGYSEPMEAAIATLEEDVPIITETLQGGYDEQIEGLTTYKDQMITGMTETTTGMADAVTAGAPSITSAAEQMMNDAYTAACTAIGFDGTKSSKFYALGQAIDTSIAAGITDSGGVVATALQDMLNSAIASLDVSALAARVNTVLGSAF